MLRELIAWVLNNYLGKYVHNLNTAQLSVALLSGEVELENLPLRKDALRNLGLPLQALKGTVGRIKLQIPVRQFRTAPWCIIVENVYVVIGPINLDEWDADAEEQAEINYKLSRLDNLEAKWRAQREAEIEGGYYAASYSGWLSYGTSLATNIVENLELKIRNVHIRYEDAAITVPNQRFACGITIDSLSARSCDSNWIAGYSTVWNQTNASFKLVELTSMSIYWQPLSNQETFADISIEELAQIFQEWKSTSKHEYVVSPVSAQARFKRDRSEMPLRTRSRPRLICDLILNEVQLTLSDWQYKQMVECVRGLDDISKYRRFRLLRPEQSVHESPKSWWIYAIRCHGLKIVPRHQIRNYTKDNLRYIEIYTKLIINPNETLSNEQKDFKDKIEKERDYYELKFLREICMNRSPDNDVNSVDTNHGRGMLLQWFPQWWGWYKTPDTQPTDPLVDSTNANSNTSIENTVPKDQNQLEDEILNALSSGTVDNSMLKRDTVFGKFNFTLKKGVLDICSNQNSNEKIMLQLQFQNLLLNIETRPRSGSHFVGLSLGSVLLKDFITENSEFRDLIKPQAKDDAMTHNRRSRGSFLIGGMNTSNSNSNTSLSTLMNTEPIFQLNYERKPLSHNTDYRLLIKTQSLDIVYNVEPIKWIVDFVMKPNKMINTKKKFEAMKNKTKMELIKNWENILEGDVTERRTWNLEIDISAPQIIFVENFTLKNSSVVVIDFGRLQLTNYVDTSTSVGQYCMSGLIADGMNRKDENDAESLHREQSEDEDAFVTPCSTPPGSHISNDSPTLCSALSDVIDSYNQSNGNENDTVYDLESTALNERSLHEKLYDRYKMELTDLQILVCRSNEKWLFASAKGSSSLHVLDRFSISLQVERRAVNTTDPHYPSLTIAGTLPKLVAHVNEQKIAAITTMLNIISSSNIQSPHRTPNESFEDTLITEQIALANEMEDTDGMPSDVNKNIRSMESECEASKLFILQFSIDQMSLEVQSRGRCIAELQVTGVKAAFSKRPEDTNITLSVHGLLLVDAIQSFGPDFELLIASHRHVGMDSISGSLKQSEPCSPNSPGSPDPMADRRPHSPNTISKAISNLQRTYSDNWSTTHDVDALITVEVLLVTPEVADGERLQIANIQFNNLDIIANQETIVELMDFANRVFPRRESRSRSVYQCEIIDVDIPIDTNIGSTPPKCPSKPNNMRESIEENPSNAGGIRTEITFDFHRLNVLILRAVMRDTYMVGRKVGTFTMSEAKIHATLGVDIRVEGSLGGLQVIDLTPEGVSHQRIFSVGKDPLTEPPGNIHPTQDLLSSLTQEVYGMTQHQKNQFIVEDQQALSFIVSRNLSAMVTIRVRMASVWYTHCARFMQELSWCATEFKQYLKNFARSIREKATDMALGLVQPNRDLGTTATPRSTNDTQTPKHQRKRLISISNANGPTTIDVRIDIVLDTPVLVLPRSSRSSQVFVVHLGKISITNKQLMDPFENDEKRSFERKSTDFDMKIFTIDEEMLIESSESIKTRGPLRSSGNYSSEENSQTKSNDTGIEDIDVDNRQMETYILDIRNINAYSLDTRNRKSFRLSALPRAEEFYSCHEDAEPVLHDTAIRVNILRYLNEGLNTIDLLSDSIEAKEILQIDGSFIKPLNLSLSRVQYEQLLETVENLFKVPNDLPRPPITKDTKHCDKSADFEIANETFGNDIKFKRRIFQASMTYEKKISMESKVAFELPIFIVQLKNNLNDPLIDIVFRDFNVNYEMNNTYETSLQISLRSLLMEDLLQPPESKHRTMLISSSPENQQLRPNSAYSSRSCPNLIGPHFLEDGITGSLPENLEGGFNSFLNPNSMAQQTLNWFTTGQQHRVNCPDTPPPSPQRMRHDNLVLYSSLIVDPESPNFETKYNSMRQTSSIDFNSLDLIVSVKSWFAFLNFFGVLSDTNDVSNANNTKDNTTELLTDEIIKDNSELDISVRSLTLVFVRPEYELAKANVSNAHFVVRKMNHEKIVKGKLGSVSLNDSTIHGALYRERFLTSGNEALSFTYSRDEPKRLTEPRELSSEALLKIKMASVRYVHTKRFIAEIQIFFNEFQGLQTPTLIRKIKSSESRSSLQQKPTQLSLSIKAGSPIILLPLSAKSNKVIVADLGEFSLRNSFHFASDTNNVISVRKNENGPDEILDKMVVDLVNTDLFAGERHLKHDEYAVNGSSAFDGGLCMDMDSYVVCKKGPSLLNDKCHLKLIVERNLQSWRSHNVPDFSVHGTLSRLEAVLNLQQYQLVRGFLQNNLGEPLDDLNIVTVQNITDSRFSLSNENILRSDGLSESTLWTSMSITLDLQDVSVRLQVPKLELHHLNLSQDPKNISFGIDDSETSLACINFVKSSLKIDQFSDGSQDIDLVSQEILVTDTRFTRKPEQTLCGDNPMIRNVFTTILQPTNKQKNGEESVQAEIHSRKRQDYSKYTILLNNMRVMAILDWMESVRDFLSQDCDENENISEISSEISSKITNVPVSSITASTLNVNIPDEMEVILNITNSELIFVEKTDRLDTNAVILKSTTVLSYRPIEVNKVMSINLNHLEVFSCILDCEEDTALSIIDPITINMDVKQNTLDIQLQKRLCIRLSYNDVKMFIKMFESLPNQTRKAQVRELKQVNDVLVLKLSTLGFSVSDCIKALELCNNVLDDSALWLTQHCEPVKSNQAPRTQQSALNINAIEVCANCISICVIDDCKDADVPLLEISLSDLQGKQELGALTDNQALARTGNRNHSDSRLGSLIPTPSGSVYKAGHLKGVFSIDYYNRMLSGWESLIEAWKCESNWNCSVGASSFQPNRLHLSISSEDLLKLNITTTIIELFNLVHENWMQDYYGNGNSNDVPSIDMSPCTSLTIMNYRRRNPFVPFALKNETGLNLSFTTFVSNEVVLSSVVNRKLSGQQWITVEPGQVVPFGFGHTNKQRHHDSHKLNLHQIGVRIDGWTEVGPVSIDKVGVFFRYSRHEMAEFVSLPRARIVFSVSLEGSAQKLVTIRSALRIVNKLDRNMLIKMEHLKTVNNPDAITAILKQGETYSVPLSHVNAHMYVVPISIQSLTIPSFSSNDSSSRSQRPDRMSSKVDLWLKKTDANDFRMYFCERSIYWRDMDEGADVQQWIRTCKSSREKHFRIVAAIFRDGYPEKDFGAMPGHTIVLLPSLRLHNLLPCDLLYRLSNNTQGRISPSETANVYEVDLENQTEIIITLDSYPGAEKIIIPNGSVGTIDYRIRLTDTKGRPLCLRASIQMIKGSGLQITISAPYWLINRTGLPLIFRQEGVSHESSGQFDEHEQARLVSPLMFSFTDPDAPPALTVRLGKRYGSSPPWCQPFNLHKDILHQQLRSGISTETFIIGTELRCGRGRYAKTRVVTFSPRFQLYNRSSYKLQFAQKCFANSSMDLSAPNTFIEAVPSCHLPFHWPRLDKDQELCVRLPDIDGCMWSGAVPIHETQSLYINIRNMNGDMHFLRLEIVLQGATYFLLFGDAQVLPPPIRIDNYSDVAMKFYQPGCRYQWRSIIRPHSSIAYVLDEPMGMQSLVIEAPGGVSHNYSLNELGTSLNLTYENYIYIAFSGTFRSTDAITDKNWSDYDIGSQELVLTVIDGRVYLAKKQQGNRAQLWRMNQDRQLEHEGSSPPIEPGKKSNVGHRLVLDLEKAPQPKNYVPLVVRPSNKQRKSTQTWNFTEEGRLMCEHSNMCVQSRGGFFGLRPGSEAVLGMIVSDTHVIRDGLVPLEQAIRRAKLRAGSGYLSVSVCMDGPIKNLRIKDVKSTKPVTLALDPTWKHVSNILTSANSSTISQTHGHTVDITDGNGIAEFYADIKLSKGIGISIISKLPCIEELAFVTLENISTEAISTPNVRSLDFSVGDIQIDNNLFDTPCPVLLFTTRNTESSHPRLPAMHLNVKILPSPNANAIIFEHLTLSLRPLTIYLEERLILRMAIFLGLGKSLNDTLPDESDYEAHRVATKVLAANAKRYYFGDLQIVPSQIRLSVITASKLLPQLVEIKKSLGLTLIKFEDAVIDFEKFTDKHHFETMEVYLRAVKTHYKQQLKWQAAFILGSVDFLGNPLGFASDLSEGVSGLLFEGSVKSLVKNVTHGISNSTAKLTETISDGLGRVVLDEQDTETRQRILEMPSGSSTTGDHLVAGIKGLSFGLLGGVTSIVKHTYIGAQNDGLQGFISGLGKGIVGTVTKPVIGVLDLASGTANAVRETSKSSNRSLPERKRLPRCVTGAPGGLLPPYSSLQSRGQQYLFLINKRNFNEHFMAYEPCLYDGRDSKLRLLVSSENVWIFSRNEDSTSIILSYHLSELVSCHAVSANNSTSESHRSKRAPYYIELCLNLQDVVKRPRVRCSNEEMAERAARHISYAKRVYDERELTLNYETVIDE